MGIFATYNGFIYNEFFAIPIEFFGSCYDETPQLIPPYPEMYYPRTSYDCVYTLGMDPRWF
jgi:hypothetical protein